MHLDPPRVGERVPDTLTLARGEELTLTWSAPAAAWADQITYQTRLGDGPWTTREERSVTLVRLPPGPFTFEVRAGLAGAWGPVASVSGARVAAWDEGPLAWVAALALTVAGAALAVRLRTRTLRRRQAALEREVEERTAQVRAQAQALEARTAALAEQAARLAELENLRTRAIVNLHHELRTPLTLVMGGVARLTRPDDAREAAAHELVLRNAARLEALLGQLGDVARLERGEIAPRTRRLEVPATAATLVARFAGLATERGVTLVGPAPAPEPHAAVDDAVEGPEGAPLVLVVEDNADMRAWFVEELREGWRVATAVDGEHGLARARALAPALVLSDVMMPRLDGLALARRLRAETATPILLVSAKAGATDREAALAVADSWLAKPFSSQDLRAAVQRLCGGAHEPELRSEADRRFLARLQGAVDARLADPDLDVPALAHAVATSERTLHRELARIAGVSPARWIREHRLRRAEEMLRRGERRTVSEVAAAVGMSRAWFTRVYRGWAGRPPGEDLPEA